MYKYNDQYIAYNSLTNALALMSISDYREYIEFEKNKVELGTTLEQDLVKGGFLIEDNFDEIAYLRYRMNASRYSKNTLGLTIAPTSDCNFRCIYCYEKDSIRQKVMTNEVQDNLIEFIKSFLDHIDNLHITWYGGEPLLAIDIVEDLSKKIIKLCKENNVVYDAGMITNGYLLTEKNVKKINDSQVNFLQITLDGGKETHDKRRFLKGNVGTFDTILKNLVDNKESLAHISLRINVDKTNGNEIESLLHILQDNELNSIISPYLGHVRDINDCYAKGDCLVTQEYSEMQLNLSKKINLGLENFYPNPISNVCGADSLYFYVIDADGSLYKCWDDIGYEDRCIGTLSEYYINPTLLEYLSHDATEIEECRECKYLPICMGGCPHLFGKAESCVVDKYTLEDKLRHYTTTVISSNLNE